MEIDIKPLNLKLSGSIEDFLAYQKYLKEVMVAAYGLPNWTRLDDEEGYRKPKDNQSFDEWLNERCEYEKRFLDMSIDERFEKGRKRQERYDWWRVYKRTRISIFNI